MDTDMDMVMTAKRNKQYFLSTACWIFVSMPVLAQQNLPGSAVSNSSNQSSAPSPSANNTEDDQTPKLGKSWVVQPRIALTETLTDRVNISQSAGNKEGDLITELSPGIRVDARTARLKGHFDYALHGQVYARHDYSRTQNSLNTFGSLEAVDQWLFVDFSGIIAQQSISAFGSQSPNNSSINNNSTETATYRLSPHIQGHFGGWADYTLRYNRSTTHAQSTLASDIDLDEWTGQLVGSTPFHNLRWTIDGNRQHADYSNGRQTTATVGRAMLTYALTSQFRVSASGGRESNNYASADQESRTTHGYGFDWNPTQRTQISAFKERRFFGDGHRINLSHRFPLSSIRFTDTRDVSVLPNQFATAGLGTIYDIFYEQVRQQFPNLDESTLASYVSALLAANGIDPNAQVTSGFLTSRASVQRRQQLALAFFGARNTLTLMANRNESQSTFANAALADDLSQNSMVKQQGFSLNLSHRLSEKSTLNALASHQKSTGNGTGTQKATTKLYQVNVSTKLGAKTNGVLSLRRTEFDNNINPFTENALVGTVTFTY